ncbi:MAG: nuclear transport factor 2 family protein [Caulobacterales bacterium]|nr:nuclear transport factor 2 family protein [Caulobacterales bacterium]
MTDTTPIQQPVTGRENLDELAPPERALAQFYKALNGRDIALMEQNWDPTREAVMDNPLGGIKRGWAEIRPTYERLFAAPGSYSFEFWDYTRHQGGDVFWVVGRERGSLTGADGALDLAIRTSRIFRSIGGTWRQVHHHGSIEDPDMLARYLRRVGAARSE